MPPFLLGIFSWFMKGGWQLFLAIGVAMGIFLAAKDISDRLTTLGAVQTRYEESLAQQSRDIARIGSQNDEIINNSRSFATNTATLPALRDRLNHLNSTVTPNVDPAVFQGELQLVITQQYACMERISRGETNATCV